MHKGRVSLQTKHCWRHKLDPELNLIPLVKCSGILVVIFWCDNVTSTSNPRGNPAVDKPFGVTMRRQHRIHEGIRQLLEKQNDLNDLNFQI